MSGEGSPVRTLLVREIWIRFNWLWTLSTRAQHDEHAWRDCRDLMTELFEQCGIDRRAQPRRRHDE